MPNEYERLLNEVGAIRAQTRVPWADDGAGVTRADARIAALVHPDAYADSADRHRILLVGCLSGSSEDAAASLAVLDAYARSRRLRNRIALSAIPCGNPDGLASGGADGGNASGGYPPEGGFFNHETDPESRYLWRYIGFMAPDLVLEVRAGDGGGEWGYSGTPNSATAALGASEMDDAPSALLPALASGVPNDLGRIPGLRLTVSPSDGAVEPLTRLARALDARGVEKSPARAALDARRGRSARDVASALVPRYGDTLDPVIYTKGVAVSGRLRYGALTGETAALAEGVEALVAPYLDGGEAWFGESAGGANHAGLVWCDEMFAATGDARYRDVLVATADLYRGNPLGEPPPPCDPDYRTEDFFFCGALTGRAFALTGDERYLDIQAAFLLNADIQRDDGLFWHCRSSPFHWGRGNGFAALGYAETLTHLPENHPSRDALIESHALHLAALRRLQRPSGMLSQLLDFAGSYQELTAVCMVGCAVARGLRLGWLDESHRDFAESLWRAASERVSMDGAVVDGCTGTGAGDSRRFYLDRAAEFGQDDRTGNLALWFAVEMERLRRGE